MRKNRTSQGTKFIITFSITLLGVLLAGMVGIVLCKYAFGMGDQGVQAASYHFFWESIPEEAEKLLEENPDSKYADELADPEYMAEHRILARETTVENQVTLCFAGDVLFDDNYAVMASALQRGEGAEGAIASELLTFMRDADIMMLNNEFTYTSGGTPTEGKQYTFRANPGTVSWLDEMGVDIVSLANNHTYDYGETGLLDTLSTLEDSNIPYVGAGRNLEEASAPVYFIAGNMKIAIVSATQIERLDQPDTKGATEDSAGVFRCWNPEKLYEEIALAKENSDFVVVYIHWGTENTTEIDWAQEEQAPKIAEAGADLIIGDHPHCLQGMDYFGETPVIYSMGNYWFNSKTVDTCLVQVVVDENGLQSFQIIPAIQEDCKVKAADETQKARILQELRSLSPDVAIDQNGYVSRIHVSRIQ